MDDDIDCNRVIHALYEFLDGELPSEGRRTVESHLHGCPHCFSAFDFEAELRIVVRSRLQVELPSGLQVRIVAALEQEQKQEGPAPSTPSYGGQSAPPPRPSLGGGTAPFGGTSPLG